MAVTSRETLKRYCLGELGYPVIEINVAEEQLEDRIDEALQIYQEFHSEATERIYIKHQITDSDMTNKYIPIPEGVISITRVFPVTSSFLHSKNMFSFQYQFALSDFHTLNDVSGSINYYEQVRQYMSLLDMTFNGQPQTTYVRKADRLYIWGDFNDGDIKVGEWVVCEVMKVLDPALYPKIWNDMYLKKLTTALIKRQWGNNMKKFEGMQMPGGVTMNGQLIFDEASQEIPEIIENLRLEYEKPIDFLVG